MSPWTGRLSGPLRRLAAVGFAVLLAGCATAVAPKPSAGPVRQWPAGELIASLNERDRVLRSLRALARMDYAGPEGKSSFQEAVLVERPDRLRLETLSFLGAILVVTVNGAEIIGHHTREGIFVRGEPTRENLLRYTQIPLALHEITALLLGVPPVAGDQAAERGGNQVVVAHPDGGRDIVSFYGPEKVPTRWERTDANGGAELSADFSQYAPTGASPFPSRIVLESAAPKRRLEVRYQEPELNGTIAPELFTQQKPSHAKELPIEAVGG